MVKTIRSALIIAVLLFLVGCTALFYTPQNLMSDNRAHLSSLHPGLTKDEAIKIMGTEGKSKCNGLGAINIFICMSSEVIIDISINNGYIWHHAQGSSEASMQDHRSRWERLMRRMERRSVVPNSWMSFGVLLDKSCLALVQTNSSGLSCGAYPGKRWTRSLF